MNINATLFGQVIFAFAIMMAMTCFVLGKRKGEQPIITALIGFLSAMIPVVAIVYLVILVRKPDKPVT